MPSRIRSTRLLLILSPVLATSLAPSPPASPRPPPSSPLVPIVVHTWSGPFTVAAAAAAAVLGRPQASVLDAIEAGGSACEQHQCEGTVGYGGSPDEDCETTLDALVMDGETLDVGAVGALRRVKHAVSVARRVLEHTEHSLLVGELATRFALEHGFPAETLSTAASNASCRDWTHARCQPNARRGPDSAAVTPDPRQSCGPYHYDDYRHHHHRHHHQPLPLTQPPTTHDTIALIALNASGHMAAGTSTNGQAHKIPGRVGDAPLPGSGAYVDNLVGGCGATGDGDILMRFLPCYHAVENMRRGMHPRRAAEDALRRVLARYPRVRAGLVLLNNRGEHAGAATNWAFSYSFRRADMLETGVVRVEPMPGEEWPELR
ncbi:hypothetical protein E4U43_000976 [Claviceps pusilla]|uniref:Asparaginase n=1 Tax=Claviceps pusilla TaxID=123648 RepID=A0A9P7N9R9_9HYPO|nr:hypothetical protein E4U43_000976 [Claviceps pusilla]